MAVRAKRHVVLMMSDLQSGAEQVSYVTDADAARLEAEIDRLTEILTIPNITLDTTSSAMFVRTLNEHEKGLPVNTQDLINALMWRVRNQRKEIARLLEVRR